jgi:tRNA(adenine34) deaminase
MLSKNIYMEQALKNAYIAKELNEVPVGAVIVYKNHIIASTYNQMITNNNPCHHAEMLAITQACKKLNNIRLNECSIYTTLEPCVMCAGAIMHSRIAKLYFGAEDEKYGAIYNGAKVFYHPYPHKPEIYSGFYETECKEILQDFFKNKR